MHPVQIRGPDAMEKCIYDGMEYGCSSVAVRPRNITDECAEISIQVELVNEDTADHTAAVTAEIFNARGNFVTACSRKALLKPCSHTVMELAVFLVNPIRSNHLYCARVLVQENERKPGRKEQNFEVCSV